MDASNLGQAVLDPACESYIQIQFDDEEKLLIDKVGSGHDEFSINVREHLCIAIALWSWGSKWSAQANGRTIHVKCWSDNAAAVSWCNRMHSNNAFSQEINRAIGLAEVYFNLRVSADHIPGLANWMADAASRAWTEPYIARWTNFSSCWVQTQENLHRLLESLQSVSLATTSKIKYASTWTQWCRWCERLQFAKWLPEDRRQHSYQLALFATYCWKYGWGKSGSGNSASTVLSKVSHIAWHHRRTLGYNVGLLPGHQLAITGMRRKDPSSKPKSPVTSAILKCLMSSSISQLPSTGSFGGGFGAGLLLSFEKIRIFGSRFKDARLRNSESGRQICGC
ncbi:hypothetical protein PHYSODRAFT_527792 [Phytophthora sojae]|uniref:Uncharacterized protein n=1 Tax=Phytophthora sojae (strain P6497) TaxID=1094619 RepID=G5A873_PHYSP|nr:hypothetical protein PHYSODRAFT_527792 [Phytophthora sojae]EGZ08099.1 hypothetical protein PHYSODRAFT_527792 [Phytophthora sojae]|eukprot:XP_009536271.1 hypothetical protein PHYSODRAFT_527792 [Phytophthora sojae]